MEAAGVGVAHHVQPAHGLLLGVARRRHQAIHQLLVRVGRRVLLERGDFLGRGRNAGEIERHAASQRAAVGFRRRLQPFARQAFADKRVDGVPVGRNRGTLHRLIGPVAFVGRALRHPLPDGLLLRGGEFLVRERGRHDARVFGEDARNDGALVGIAGDDRRHAASVGLQRLVAKIEPHSGHARTLVRPVAAEAGLGHDRPDIAIEAHLRVPRCRPQGGSQQYPSDVHRGFNIHPAAGLERSPATGGSRCRL